MARHENNKETNKLNNMRIKLGTTSYIYPVEENNLLYNVEQLSSEFEYIQLLCFGKAYVEEIINTENLNTLAKIAKNSDVKYIIHLPLDLNLLDSSISERKESLTLVDKLIREAEKYIDIEYFIMHIDKCVDFQYDKIFLNQECKKVFKETLKLIHEILPNHINKICIENTSYDLTFFAEELLATDLKMCLDIGHIYLAEDTITNFTNIFEDKTEVVHLHGVKETKDHLSLTEMLPERINETFAYLNNPENKKTIILEVFNRNNLDGCLEILNKFLKRKAL